MAFCRIRCSRLFLTSSGKYNCSIASPVIYCSLYNQYDSHPFGKRQFTKQPEDLIEDTNKNNKTLTKKKDDTLDPQALQSVMRNLRIYQGSPVIQDDWDGVEDSSVQETFIIDEDYKLELETKIVKRKKEKKKAEMGDFISPEANLLDKSVQWEAFPMEAMYTVLQHADKASTMGINNWAKQYQEPIEHWMDEHTPEYDERTDKELTEFQDILVTGDDAFIASNIQTKPGGTDIEEMDCPPYDDSPDSHVLTFDRQRRLRPPDEDLDNFIDGLEPNIEKYYPANVAAMKKKSLEVKEFEQTLIKKNKGGKWRELQQKEGKIWSDKTDNPTLFPVHDPDYTYDDWELEVKELHEREFIDEDHSLAKSLRFKDDPEDSDHLRFDYSQTTIPKMTEREFQTWEEYDEWDPHADSKLWDLKSSGTEVLGWKDLDPHADPAEQPEDEMGRIAAQSFLPPIHRDGYNFDDWNFERMKDDTQHIDPRYVHSNKRESDFLEALGLDHVPDENELDEDEQNSMENHDEILVKEKPQQWKRPLPYLSDESKWAIYWLHQEDPVKYTPRELAKKFHIQIGRAEGIIKLQHLERLYVESGYIMEDLDNDDDGIADDVADLQPTDAVWDPATPGYFEHMPQIQLLDDEDRLMAEMLEKKTLHAYHKREEYKDKKERKKFAKYGPIGSMRPPAPEPIDLKTSRFNKKYRYNKKIRHPIILTNISQQKKKLYRIAVRDTDSTLRAPSHTEFWNIRTREKSQKEYFNYKPYRKQDCI